MHTSTLILLVTSLGLVTKLANSSQNDGGILPDCPLSIFDLTLSSSTTDSLKIRLVAGLSDIHVYNISKASSILSDKKFRKDYRTVIFAHGFGDGPGMYASPRIVDGYLTRGRHNILLLDASRILNLEYLRSARAARYVGIRLGKVLIQWSKSGLDTKTLELIGHSLGAHVVGFAGKTFFKTTGKKLPRIIALDPAGVCFRNAPSKDRVDREDADFVQVIHSNGGDLGTMTPLGHADFYLNGGKRQPDSACGIICSHNRVIDVWRSAVINPTKFSGSRCNNIIEVEQNRCSPKKGSTAVMGPAADPKTEGLFYVKTYNEEPFYLEATKGVHYYQYYYYDPC